MFVAAVVVTYNIGEIYEKNFNSLVDQVDRIIIIDNCSNEETVKTLKIIESQSDKVSVVFNSENIGLSKAQNMGIKIALEEKKYNWILILDNDSYLEKNMINIMLRTYHKIDAKEKNQIRILVPNIKNKNTNESKKNLYKEKKYLLERKNIYVEYMTNIWIAIASGSLIKTDLIKEIGMFEEDFFIDYIDTEYCLRTLKNGYKICIVRDAELLHELGNKQQKKIIKWKITTLNHSAFRRFYIYRNRIKVWKKYNKEFPEYVCYDFLLSLYEILLILCFEENKINNLKYIYRGVKDSLKLGKKNGENNVENQ